MLKTFSDLAKNVHFKPKSVYVDNVVFQLNYRLTFWILLVSTVLVSSRQYIGEHIRCISDHVANHVINTFCFFTTTFTVVRHLNESQAPHPGVGPLGRKDMEGEAVIHHAYYQWVPFVLFGQAIMFYLPHRLWRAMEGGTVKLLVSGLENSFLALQDSDFRTEYGTIPSRNLMRHKVNVVRGVFQNRLEVNRYWGYQLMACEMLNAFNLLIQWLLTDEFLGGRFTYLGPAVIHAGESSYVGPDPLDVVFPKVTKCTFQKYGPSGTIQSHDALCVMALNVINEKIYTFLWFWFVFMAAVTVLGMLWRLATILLFSRSPRFNRMLFRVNTRHDPDLDVAFNYVIDRCDFSSWLFLYYINKNMHTRACDELFRNLYEDWRQGSRSGSPPSEPLGGPNGYGFKDTLPLSDSGHEPLLESPLSSTGRRVSSTPSDRSDRPHKE